jgi:hypothetical protein
MWEKPKTTTKDLDFGEDVKDLGIGEIGNLFDEVSGSGKRNQKEEQLR